MEDNADASESLRRLLMLWGHEVETVPDGRDRAGAGPELPARGRALRPRLPGEIDGHSVAKATQGRLGLASPFLVALTGFGQPDDRERSLAAGFDRHLTKPADLDLMRRLLDSLPGGKPDNRPPSRRVCPPGGRRNLTALMLSSASQTEARMEWITRPEAWIGFFTLTALEIVLGIDNIIFISILAGKLPARQQKGARRGGLLLAMLSRILLLFSLSWVIGLTAPLFTVPVLGHEVSGRDLVLLLGGLFLVAKSTHEIHVKLEGDTGGRAAAVAPSLASVLDPDPPAGRRLLPRLRDHGGGHGAGPRSDGGRGRGRRRRS